MSSLAQNPLAAAFRAGWQVFRHELLFVVWALMEVALISPVFLAMTPWTVFWSPGMVTVWLLLIMLIPFNLSRLNSILRVPVERQQIVMVAALILTLVLSWRMVLYSPSGIFDFSWLGRITGHLGDGSDPNWSRELALFVIIAFVWWRGIALAGRGVDYRDVGLRMRAGILLALFFVAGFGGSQLPYSVTPFVLLFLFASLLSVVLTRVGQLELSRSGRSFPLGPAWLLTIVLTAAAVVFVTGIIAGIVSGDSLGSAVGWFKPLWIALRFALAAVVLMLSLLISPLLIGLVMLVEWLFGLFGGSIGEGLDGLREAFGAFQNLQQVTAEEVVENGGPAQADYRQLLTGLTMLFVVLLVGLGLSRLYRMARPAAETQRQSVSPLEGVRRPRPRGIGQRILGRFNRLRRWQAATSIRQTYSAMGAAAADRGYPRAHNETAYEYLPTLARAWPGMQSETALITEAYIRAHYGELPETEEELARILEAWGRLSEANEALHKH